MLYYICEKVGYKKGDKWPTLMVFAIAFVANIGVVMLPFQVGVVANFGFLKQASGGTLDYQYSSYLLFSVIYSIIFFIGFIFLCKYIFKPDMTPLLNNKVLFEQQKQKLNQEQKLTLIIFGILLLILMAPSFMPKGFIIRTIIDQLGTTASVALVVGLASFLKFKGKPFIDVIELIQKGVGWNIIFMLSAAFSFAGAITSQKSGLVPYFMKSLQPLLQGHGAYIIMVLFIIITIILTNLINHTVVSAVMIPIVYTFSVKLGFNPIALTALLVFVVDFGILFPSSSVTGAVLHGNTEWISAKQIINYGLVTCIYMMLITFIFGLPLVNLIF